MNPREQRIKQGFWSVLGLCSLLVLAQLLRAVALASAGNLGLIELLPLALAVWAAWSLYSGKQWPRMWLAFSAGLAALLSLTALLGGNDLAALLFTPRMGLTATSLLLPQAESLLQASPALHLFSLCLHSACLYITFLYGPVQEYFRYIGAEGVARA